MYHAESDTPAVARTSNLNEELGQVSESIRSGDRELGQVSEGLGQVSEELGQVSVVIR